MIVQLFVWDRHSTSTSTASDSLNEKTDISLIKVEELASYDPACLAAMTYLTYLNIPYVVMPTNNPSLSITTHTLPVAYLPGHSPSFLYGLEAILFEAPWSMPCSFTSSTLMKATPLTSTSMVDHHEEPTKARFLSIPSTTPMEATHMSMQEHFDLRILLSLLNGPILQALIQARQSITHSPSKSIQRFSWTGGWWDVTQPWQTHFNPTFFPSTSTSSSFLDSTHPTLTDPTFDYLKTTYLPTLLSSSTSMSTYMIKALMYGYLAPCFTLPCFNSLSCLLLSQALRPLHEALQHTLPSSTIHANRRGWSSSFISWRLFPSLPSSSRVPSPTSVNKAQEEDLMPSKRQGRWFAWTSFFFQGPRGEERGWGWTWWVLMACTMYGYSQVWVPYQHQRLTQCLNTLAMEEGEQKRKKKKEK
ncbi:hypothetical protein HMI54_005286 [Coelomomyces lativittatus]|nr:hypothetical protein HMI56_002521 [Coelomomyces lativittatus]KAJ1508689.1 hypothetical protein HMI55_000281 [Coelomomyces lativittatus]KAJ1517515.1 hypothetical protein HMI54_005286 [Coelomomyces lativittatus]